MPDDITQLEEQIAALKKQLTENRRRAPREPVSDYNLTDARGKTVKLSQLFGNKCDLLIIHNMGVKCPYCTLWADGFTGFTKHLENRAGFALTSPDDHKLMARFAADRKWNFRVFSHKGSTFAHDMGYEPEPGKVWPGVSAFHREPDGSIVRTGHASFGPGDDFCALWSMLDLLQGGPAGWEPKYRYGKAAPAKRAPTPRRSAPRKKVARKAPRRSPKR
jgi:predicted dithiol-disulfide oxidoreductase (DUF899 family)